MFAWLRSRLWPSSPLAQWSVALENGQIITGDGNDDFRALPADELRKVEVATDDSGPWGADVVFLLFASKDEPAGVFPLEASGRDEFLAWLETKPGYQGNELRKAMGSTSVARFVIFDCMVSGQ